MDLRKNSNSDTYKGIDEPTEKLLISFNVPMDCYLLTTLIAINFDKQKFYGFFFKKDSDRYDFLKLLNFISLMPVIILILFSGIIVFCVQFFILILFVDSESGAYSEDSGNFLLRIVLIIIFAMIIMPDYQTGIKKIAIGFKMTSLMHKLLTISLSGTQSLVTLIVLTASVLLIQLTGDIEDLLQNFMALYVIIQINDIVFTFLHITNILNGLKILGFMTEKIQHFQNIKSFWRKLKKKSIINSNEDNVRDLVNKVVLWGQIFFYIFVITITYIIFNNSNIYEEL